jgi:hypothetical protein
MIEVTRPAIAEHPFLRGVPPGHLDALAEVGADVCFPAGHFGYELTGRLLRVLARRLQSTRTRLIARSVADAAGSATADA